MASLFISYSRKDIAAARRLTETFKDQDLDFWIDWEGIPPTVDWWKEIQKGIEEADIFLFLLSPDSAVSKVCRQEIEHAAKNGKRLIAIVVRDVKGDEVPAELRSLNWIFLRENDEFQPAFNKLITAIKTDYAWVQAHRELQVKALEWERNNHDNSFLLRGAELQEAEYELGTNTSKQPYPTELQRGYVLRSRQVTERQRRVLVSAAVGAAIVMTGLAIFGFVQAGFARKAQSTAEANASAAQTAEARAKEQATIALSRQLAAQAEGVLEKDPVVSTLLSIESIRTYPDISSRQSLHDALSTLGSIPTQVLPPLGVDAGLLYNLVLSPDGRWLAAAMGPEGTGTLVRLWDLKSPATAPQIVYGPEDHPNDLLEFSADGKWLASLSNQTVRLWDMRSHQLRLIHDPDGIQFLEFSPAGDRLATLSGTSVLKLYNLRAANFEASSSLSQNDGVASFVFSQDGRWMAGNLGGLQITHLAGGGVMGAGSDQGTLQVWDINSMGSEPIQLNGQIASDSPLAISQDGRWIAGAGMDGHIQLWDTRTPAAEPNRLTGPTDLLSLMFNGNWLAGISRSGTVQLWDVTSPAAEPLVIFDTQENIGFSRFSPDGHWLAILSSPYGGNYFMRLWDMRMPFASPRILRGSESGSMVPTFSSTGRWLLMKNQSGVIQKWDLQSFLEEPRILSNPGTLDNLAFTPRGDWLAGVADDATVWLWNIKHLDDEPIRRLNGLRPMGVDYHPNPLVFSPAGSFLAGGSGDGGIRLWDMHSPTTQAQVLAGSKGNIQSQTLGFSPDGAWLASLSDGVLQMWDMSSPATTAHSPAGQKGSFTSLAFSHNAKWLAAVNEDNSIWLWNLHDLNAAPRLLNGVSGEEIYMLAFSQDDLGLFSLDISIGGGDVLNEWDLTSFTVKQLQLTGIDYSNGPPTLMFSPDGHWLETTGSSPQPQNVITLWDLTAARLEPISLHGNSAIGTVSFSPDSRWLVGGNTANSLPSYLDPHIVQIWNLQSLGTPPLVLRSQRVSTVYFAIVGVGFSQNNHWLVSASTDGDMRLWSLDQDVLVKKACQMVGRNLTRAEWIQYFRGQPYPTKQADATCPQWPLDPESPASPGPMP